MLKLLRTYRPVLPGLAVTWIFTLCFFSSFGQKVDSIYFHLYTDSLKKGTYNYINVDGKLSNGRFLPLDSTHVEFNSTLGFFKGNSLWIPLNTKEEKAEITVTLKSNRKTRKSIELYIKKQEEDEVLKTEKEILEEMKERKKKGKKGL